MTYDIVYRPDGLMVLDHVEDPDRPGELLCGQAQYIGNPIEAGETPACPRCLRGLLDYIANHS